MFRRLPKFEMDQPGGDQYAIPEKHNKAGIGTILLMVAAVGLIGTCFFTMLNGRAAAKDKAGASPTPTMLASLQSTASPTPTARPASSGDADHGTPETIVQTVEVEVTRQVPVTQIVNQSKTVVVTRVVAGPTIIETQIVQVPVVQTQIVQVPIIQTVIVVVTAIPASATATASQTASPTLTLTPTATPTPTPTATATPTETPTP